jgi:predicted DNA-binding transcriptional regulator YafY
MSVSLRTIYRDIQTLINQGVRISGERGIGYVMRPGFLLPPLMFRDEEIEALTLGSRWVAQQADKALARAAQDAVAKIMTVLPENLKERVEYAGLFPVPTEDRALDAVEAKVLREAIRLERKLRIVYRDEQGRETTRVIWPVALAFFERIRMLVA